MNEIFHGIATARAIVLFERDIDLTGPQALGRISLETMEHTLSGQNWLVGDRLTLADLAGIPEPTFRDRFRRTPLWRAHPDGLARNAQTVLKNLQPDTGEGDAT